MKNNRLGLALDYVKYTGENIFLTGKAGTGKTTFLQQLVKEDIKRSIVLAPTGVAAINAGGVTIHSFFQLPLGPLIPDFQTERNGNRDGFNKILSRVKINIIKSLDLLIIDEISMVRADLLDGIDKILRKYREWEKPFGGIQLLMIGDLEQLAPIVRAEEWRLLRNHYKSTYFFSSKALNKTSFTTIVLEHVYRQTDQNFIAILNKIRNQVIDPETLQQLNKRYFPNFIKENNEGYIILTTHRKKAKDINKAQLASLPGKAVTIHACITGTFPENSYPADRVLELKEGSQIMFIKNDHSVFRRYFNGKIGIVEGFEEDTIIIKSKDEDEFIEVNPVQWENIIYNIDYETQKITEDITGTFDQFPIRLAWAITIHKSQGLTFEKAIIDTHKAFTHGQLYVALSRCKTLEGLVLNSLPDPSAFIHDKHIRTFIDKVEKNPPDQAQFTASKNKFVSRLLTDLFRYNSIHISLLDIKNYLNIHSDNIAGNPILVINDMYPLFVNSILRISERFLPKLNEMLSEEMEHEKNLRLQEKVSGASIYFHSKNLEILEKILELISFNSDSKEIRKQLEESLNKLDDLICKKNSYLEVCKNGFDLSRFLKARVNETPGKSSRNYSLGDTEITKVDIQNPPLYEKLIQWRNRKAEENAVPHYMILNLKTIVLLSNCSKLDLKGLMKIKGIGKVKMEKFGKELLEIINT